MPTDQWDFVPRDDEFGDSLDRGAEEAALHVDRPVPTPAEDPGRAEVDLADHPEELLGVSYFADEEPEGASSNGSKPRDEHTEDVEELLEAQHYAFAPEVVEGARTLEELSTEPV